MAIRLHITPTDSPLVGKSHWWGAPDLPSDIPYPFVEVQDDDLELYNEPLTFVCQIRCSDIAPFDTKHLLPQRGMLYIFAPIDYFLGDEFSALDHFNPPVVIYSEQEEGLTPYDLHWEDTGESVFRPAEQIEFSLSEKESDDGMRMLTVPYQDDVAEQNPGLIALLQIDEEERWGLRFYDCGTYYILLRPEDIREGRWNNAKGELFFY